VADEFVSVSNNADTAEEDEAALAVVSEVLGLPAKPGERLYLGAAETPFEIIVNVIGAASGLVTLSQLGWSVCRALHSKLRERVANRRVQILFELRAAKAEGIRFYTTEETPNEALPLMKAESEREVQDPNNMRWWADGQWRTVGEYQKWLRRK
jgi:hypothetical protein